MNFGVLSLGSGSSTGGVFGTSAGEEVVELFSASETATPWKTSSSVKVSYHFTSSLSSNTLFANKQGSPPVDRIILLCPVLEGPGICHNFFPRDFSYVPTGKD